MTNGNILLSEDGPVKSQRRCPACHDRLLVGRAKMDGKLICQNDGYTVDADPEETRPESRLTDEVVETMLCQPMDTNEEASDMLPGVQVVKEWDLRNGSETAPALKRKRSLSADLVLFG
jgi:hypothetical protein